MLPLSCMAHTTVNPSEAKGELRCETTPRRRPANAGESTGPGGSVEPFTPNPSYPGQTRQADHVHDRRPTVHRPGPVPDISVAAPVGGTRPCWLRPWRAPRQQPRAQAVRG